MSAREPFHLLDEFSRAHIKFEGREPITLREVAIARADLEHRRRLAEIKAIARKLALLDEFLPALAERGISLGHRDIRTWDGGKTLRLITAMSGSDNKVHEALLQLGFKEVERRDSYRDEQTVMLKHGRSLLIAVDIKKPAASAMAGRSPA